MIIWLILALPTILEIIQDFVDFKLGKRDKKELDVLIRGGFILIAGAICSHLGSHSVWQGMFLSFGIFFMFFDYIMGYLLTKKFTFLGTTSKSDSVLKKISPTKLFIIRTAVFITSIIVFYHNFS